MENATKNFDFEKWFGVILSDLSFEIQDLRDGYALSDVDAVVSIEKRFETAENVIDYLRDPYIYDAYCKELIEAEEDNIIELGGNPELYSDDDPRWLYNFLEFMDANPDFKKDHIGDYNALYTAAYISEDSVDIQNFVKYSEPDCPLYEVTSYYGTDFRGVESVIQSASWSGVEEKAHEFLMKGGNVIIEELKKGGRIKITADEYEKLFIDGEFPFTPSDLETDRGPKDSIRSERS